MTTLTTAAFGPGILRILKISYRCDLSRSDGPVIPLGILADMRADDSYSLVLVARTSLGRDEASQVGGLIREDISSPFKYLEMIFDDMVRTPSPSDAFEALPDKYSLSLSFEMAGPARSIPLPRAAKISREARSLWVKDELQGHGNTAYWEMFGDAVPHDLEKTSKERDVAA